MRRLRPSLHLLPCLVLLLLVAGCGTVGYYTQAIHGGLEVLLRREPVERLLARPDLPAAERRQLELAAEIRAFASRELALPENRSYRAYSRLGRPYATWNVVAAPELSVEPVTWCFPVAGCVSYRGYFSREKAERYAAKLRRRGFDADVGGSLAYSTLGRFADPLLDTFLFLPDAQLAALLFHELAHQVLYLPGDTAFSESFATAVEREGVRRWLAAGGAAGDAGEAGLPEAGAGRPEEEAFTAYLEAEAREERFVELVLATRERLAELYASELPYEAKRTEKRRIFERLRSAGEALQADDPAWAAYAPWFREPDLDNADLAAVGAYNRWVDAFGALLAEAGGDLESFYRAAERLAELPEAEREQRLLALDRRAASVLTAPPRM